MDNREGVGSGGSQTEEKKIKELVWRGFIPALLGSLLIAGAFYAHFASLPVKSAGQSVNVSASIPIVCGNNILELGEQCDGTALGGQTCSSRGFGGGTLGCTAGCAFDTSLCTAAAPSSGGGGGGGGGSFYIPQASVFFSGHAFPLNKIVLLKDGQIVSSASSAITGSDARFKFSLPGLTAGDYVFSIYSEDSEGNRSASFSLPVLVAPGSDVKLENIFISPTISLDKEEVRGGESIAISGQSVPYSNITILISSNNEFSKEATANKDGFYLYNLDTSALEDGRHFAKAKSAVDAYESPFSGAVSFLVGDKTVVKTEENHPEPQGGDLNGDNKINIADFSIEAFWFNQPSPPQAVDLNADGKVNLTDFSIMAYNWTG